MKAQSHTLADRLRNARVSIRPEMEVSRHLFGGRPEYVVRDPITFQSHRLSREDYQAFVAFRAEEPLGATFGRLRDRGAIQDDQEEDFYRFVVQLTRLGLLALPLRDGRRLYERRAQRRKAAGRNWLSNMLFYRVPLVRPDAFLSRTSWLISPLFSRTAIALWLVAMLTGVGVVFGHWDEFASPLAGLLAFHNTPLLWALLVGLKVIHEFGHAYACKHFGGSVPEMGAYFIMFTPCAYVDASASWGFPNRLHRAGVALAGMYLESLVALVALAVWCLAEPGLVRSAAQFTVVLATLVTATFNANPLMRYDGYYVLSDLLGMPDLRAQSQAEFSADLKGLLFGLKRPRSNRTWWARGLLAMFGAASTAYAGVVVVAICVLLAEHMPLVGGFLAAMFLLGAVTTPIKNLVVYLKSSAEIADVRPRAIAVCALIAVTLSAVVLLAPWPGEISATAILLRGDECVVRAEVDGFVSDIFFEDGNTATHNATLCRLANVDVDARLGVLTADVQALEAQFRDASLEDHTSASAALARLKSLRSAFADARRDADRLTVCLPASGDITLHEALQSNGAYVRQGTPLCTVGCGNWTAAALLSDEAVVDSELAVGDVVRVWLVGRPDLILKGRIEQLEAAGATRIESPQLTHLAGGSIAVDAGSSEADQPFFEVRVALDVPHDADLRRGMTAVVALGKRKDSIAYCLYRRGLQFASRLRM